MFQTQENIFWQHTILTEAMTLFSIDSYKNGLRFEQMNYLFDENELNTRLILSYLVENKVLALEGGRYFLTKLAVEHGMKALKDIRIEQINKYTEDSFKDERERLGIIHVLYDFFVKVSKIRELREKPEPKKKPEPEPKKAKIKNLPPALRPKKTEPVKKPKTNRMDKYGYPLTLENLALERLQEWYKKNDKFGHETMDFVDAFSRLCTTFSITKDQAWSLLISMEKQKMIEIVPYHGIRLRRTENLKT